MKRILFIVFALASVATATDAQSLYFPLDGNTKETITNTQCSMKGVRTLPYAEGVKGTAARFDGYSNYIECTPSYSGITGGDFTFSLWIAPESYPMMNAAVAETTPTYTVVAGNYDATAKTGISLWLSSQGQYQVSVGTGSRVVTIPVKDDIIELGKWNNIVITLNSTAKKIYAYRNGEKKSFTNETMPYACSMGSSSFLIGKDRSDVKSGSFLINTFNGLIDEVRIDNGTKTAEQITADYNALKSAKVQPIPVNSLLGDNILRPKFHGMPAKGWTNETHGMVYYNGKYHVFFQKNGNGPYMSRLYWGHLTSTDLINWEEQPAAIAPGASANNLEANDGKGCWSGCVFQNADINGGKPTILYTGVSNAKAHIWQAKPLDDDLLTWEKQGILIASAGNPCCADASDDFRDPYFFTANGQKYIIIGTSNKSRVGTCLLYKYVGSSWQYQGLFFSGTSQGACGRFWEMPNVTPLSNGKYLFTCTPLDMEGGVKTIYWIGSIGADGKFTPDQTAPQYFEAQGTSKEGYGLLSPTFCQHNGETIVVGIVPDKAPAEVNYNWGWAHNYSLPRVLTLTADGKSVKQAPIASLRQYRQEGGYSATNVSINGEQETGVNGRQIEMLGEYQYSSGVYQGFHFFKNGDAYAEVCVGGGNVVLDLTKLQRNTYDGVYAGQYVSRLNISEGSEVKLNVVVDGSIADIFVNDDKAFSVRIFPTDTQAIGVAAFSTSAMTAKSIRVWNIDGNTPTSISEIFDTAKQEKLVSKHFCNGKLYIEKQNGELYTVSGVRIN